MERAATNDLTSGQWMRLVLADRKVEVMDWQRLCKGSMGSRFKQLIVCQSVSLSCRPPTRQMGHAQTRALLVPTSPKCPLYK